MYKRIMPVFNGKKNETVTVKVNIEQFKEFDAIAKKPGIKVSVRTLDDGRLQIERIE